jgi:aminopeptidase YwaD
MKRLGKLTFLMLMLCAGLAAQMQPQDEMFGYVIGIEGKSHQERSDFIKSQLRKMGVGFFTVPFEYQTYRARDTVSISGEDIVARIGGGQKRLVVGAHFDAVDSSYGANDDGSGVAVVLELIKTTKDLPWKCTVDFVFFDQEEKGLLGSQFYIERVVDRSRHYGMINLDIEGSGNEVYVGPVGGGDDDFLMPFVRRAAKRTKVSYHEKDSYPSSDFESFAMMRLENISISVVPKGDSELLARMTKSGSRIEAKDMPSIMKVIHTPKDRTDQMTPEALKISYDLTLTLLGLLNESVR